MFTTIDFAGADNTTDFAINNSGDIVGRYQLVPGGDSHGFLLSGGAFTTLDVAGFSNTLLHGLNDRGEIVGQSWNANQIVTDGVLISPAHRGRGR